MCIYTCTIYTYMIIPEFGLQSICSYTSVCVCAHIFNGGVQQPFLAASFCRLQQRKHHVWRARRPHGSKLATKMLTSRAGCPLGQRATCQLQVQTHSPIAPAAFKQIRRICVEKTKDLQGPCPNRDCRRCRWERLPMLTASIQRSHRPPR